MASILEALPREGALFAGRVGAVRLASGRTLLVRPDGSDIVDSATEPPHNAVPAPEEGLPTRRPAYLDAMPLFASAGRSAPADEEAALRARFAQLWAGRNEPDDFVRQDPYTGGLIRVAQALRRAPRAVALSYRLWFGDWADPGVAYQLTRVVQGLADAASMFRLPFVAGELGQEPGRGLNPSVEVLAHPSDDEALPANGEAIVLVGRMTGDLSGSAFLGSPESLPPPIDLVIESRLLEIAAGLPKTEPVGRGGLLITLARCCARAGIGARIRLPDSWQSLSQAAILFGEAQSRMLAFLPAAEVTSLPERAQPLGLPVEELGTVGGSKLVVEDEIEVDVQELTRSKS